MTEQPSDPGELRRIGGGMKATGFPNDGEIVLDAAAEVERLRADRDQRDREQRAAALREAAVALLPIIGTYPARLLSERADCIEADQ